ncbi:hypothetical protein NLG97_g2185 [Lecanicillium saksenae]|uniref:Uncharacterized protein n=1 Tax=Lecanicillium saksenae TaxID=468837 RepID=A0ACC1R2W2_9HYPO|nr:hypothetical protein NLG97_g2185 [Lecanicillium saksenae]
MPDNERVDVTNPIRAITSVSRQKRWAVKTRTGCFTCRNRRVKCDETKPNYRRCAILGRACPGYGVVMPTRTTVELIGFGPRSPVAANSQQGWRSSINIESRPPNWDFVECLRYYYSVVRPEAVNDMNDIRDPPIHSKTFNSTSFMCHVMTSQIARATKSRGRILKPGEDPAFAGLWQVYYYHMGQHISEINSSIRGDAPAYNIERALYGISVLLALDLLGHLTTWRAHVRGYLALVQRLGGPKAVLKLPKPAPSSFWIVLPIAVETNALCPALQQIQALNDFEDEDLAAIYDYEFAAELPYPTDLFLAMFHISRLRYQIASGDLPDSHALDSSVADVMDRIEEFDRAEWLQDKEEEANGLEVLDAVAHACQVAIRLYGIMTLPRAAVASWAASRSYPMVSALGRYESLRTFQTAELMRLLQDAWSKATFKGGLAWSLTVAGVAAADGAVVDQEFVAQCLLDIWHGGETGYSLEHDCRLKLQKLWASAFTNMTDEQCPAMDAPILVQEDAECTDNSSPQNIFTESIPNESVQPTVSHALADKSTTNEKVQGVLSVDHDGQEVLDLGWDNDDETDESRRLVQGMRNHQLWTLIRRFNKQSFEVRAIDEPPLAGLDMNIADKDEFSPDKLRAQLERAYISVVLRVLSAWGHVARLQSWREGRRTCAFLAIYAVSWLLDILVPTAVVSLVILILMPDMRNVAFPPMPIALIDSKTGGHQTPPAGVLGTTDTATGAPEAVQGEGAEQEAHSFVNSIGSLAFSTTVGDPTLDETVDKAEESGAGQLAQDVSDAKSNATKGHSDIVHGKTKAPVSAAVWEKARPVMHGLADVVDTWERFGNLLSPTTPFPTYRPRLKLASILLPIGVASCYMTAYIFTKTLGFIVGLVFFGQPLLTRAKAWLDRSYPAWQRLLELRNSILKGIPTNAQLAITLLRIGEKNKAPLPPPPSSDVLALRQKAKPVDGTTAAVANNDASAPVGIDRSSKSSNKGSGVLGFLKSTVKGGVKTALAVDRTKAAAGAHHAKERKGVVNYNADYPKNGPVCFDSRYDGQKGFAYLTETSTTPALSWSLKADDVRPAWSILLSDIEQLKKVGGLAWPNKVVVGWSLQKQVVDGLLIRTRDGKQYHLTALFMRDELFNRLIAMADQMWELR